MGKVSPKDRQTKKGRQKKRSKSETTRYIKPGALAQIRYSKATASKSCTDLGKKRIAVLGVNQNGSSELKIGESKSFNGCTTFLSPVRPKFSFSTGAIDMFDQSKLHHTPKTPRAEYYDSESESRLESLPTDLLVKVLCHLHHDQLRAVFHVSQKVRKAVIIARQFHFNYTTPDRTRQEMLNTITPLPADHWPFMSNKAGKRLLIASPHTPKAPKHGPRLPSRFKNSELRQISAVLFQESAFSTRSVVPSVLPKPSCKSLASNRVLLYEDDLCQAVAQNKLH